MKLEHGPIEEYIKSGEYFADARTWYNFKYLNPLPQKSFLLIVCSVLLIISVIVGLNLRSLFPIVKQIRYSLSTDSYQSSANIIKANVISKDPLASIADIMVKNYLIRREEYDYDRLKDQFIFIQNNSTRIVFRKFFNFMDIDNPNSPVMLYQKYTRRSVKILSVSYPKQDEAIITFSTLAKTSGGEIFENMLWQATINFEIDKINLSLPSDTRFNFVVTNYRLKLLEDKINK